MNSIRMAQLRFGVCSNVTANCSNISMNSVSGRERQVEVIARNYDDTITLRIAGTTVPLGRAAAIRVWASRS